ncbi:MAG TPA: hypothetical protein VFP84_12960, partial [Kofleriaceae bacterium]|nr:hypothetical protein [Kofleriaceae bacterium]
PTVAQLADAYHRLARGARQRRALIDDRDVRAVDHLGVLRDLGGRMTAAHLAAAAAAFAQRLPRRLAARRALRGAHASQLADDAHYPAGGFTAITPGGATTGNLANLVSSELVYMEDDDPVDAFALRFVEGELLHYTRDDSVLRRHRHVIAIALGAELAAARVKDRALPWQRLIVVLGLVIACVRWLVEQLAGPRDDQALTVRLAFPPAGLGDERPIVALLLGAEIARGVVVIVDEPWPATVAAIEAAAGAAIADLVVITHGDGPAMPRGVRGLRLEVAGPAPRVEAITVTDPTVARGGDPDGDPWHQWGNAAEDLLRWLA